MMRVFKTRNFLKWTKKEKVTDRMLNKAVNEMLQGLFDGNLGSGFNELLEQDKASEEVTAL